MFQAINALYVVVVTIRDPSTTTTIGISLCEEWKICGKLEVGEELIGKKERLHLSVRSGRGEKSTHKRTPGCTLGCSGRRFSPPFVSEREREKLGGS